MKQTLIRLHHWTKRQSRTYIVLLHMRLNWLMNRRRRRGIIEIASGHIPRTSVEASVVYIQQVFADYLTMAHLSKEDIQGKRVLEIGPGDTLGVALLFLCAGACEVVCLDKFAPTRKDTHMRDVYRALYNCLSGEEQSRFDSFVVDGNILDVAPVHLMQGIGIEDATSLFEPAYFDLIVSRSVLEEVHAIDVTISVMKRLLAPDGMMVHKIDLRDYGMFSLYGHHPLTFLTIPERVYTLMTSHRPQPNRKRVTYYREKMQQEGMKAYLVPTHRIEEDIQCIRPHLQPAFRGLSDEDLRISGLFLVAHA